MLTFSSSTHNPYNGSISGSGTDHDGSFRNEGGLYNLSTGRFAWGELYEWSTLYSEVKLQYDGKSKLTDTYKSTRDRGRGMQGRLDLELVDPFQDEFSVRVEGVLGHVVVEVMA